MVELRIRDDGTGFPDREGTPHTPTRDGGMGTPIMNYRAEMIGATLEVVSDAGQTDEGGVTVTCSLKLPESDS